MNNFTFIIPIVNHKSNRISDYSIVELLLRNTLTSISNQTHRNINIIVVCHQLPSWHDSFPKALFLIIPDSNTSLRFDHKRRLTDKGVKYMLGVLYAYNFIKPELIMLTDGDDYINIGLADCLLHMPYFLPDQDSDFDAYMIQTGIHVDIKIEAIDKIIYRNAYIIDKFPQTCGSCRIFKARALYEKASPIIETLSETVSKSHVNDKINYYNLPNTLLDQLANTISNSIFDRNYVINIIGRHGYQRKAFRFHNIQMIGAAKNCGHEQHAGKRKGAVHKHAILADYPLENFYHNFGVDPS